LAVVKDDQHSSRTFLLNHLEKTTKSHREDQLKLAIGYDKTENPLNSSLYIYGNPNTICQEGRFVNAWGCSGAQLKARGEAGLAPPIAPKYRIWLVIRGGIVSTYFASPEVVMARGGC